MKSTTGYIVRSYVSKIDDSEQPFALWVPRTYSGRRKYPLLVALHGMDADHRMIPEECFRIHERGFREDMIALFPFGRGDIGYEWMGEADVWDTINWVKAHYRIDARQQYLTGLSMGGFAVWRLACQYPEQWAAIAPVCGGGIVRDLIALKDVPVWCVHGERDPWVNVDLSRQLVAELRRLHFRVRYDELHGWEHNSWEWLYDPNRTHDTLADFFLRFRKRVAPKPILKPARRGSFRDLFSERVIIRHPAKRATARERNILQAEATRIARFSIGDHVMRTGQLIVKADQDLTPADLRAANHLMLGKIDHHRCLAAVRKKLQLKPPKAGSKLAGIIFREKSGVTAILQPSPWNRRRLLGIITYRRLHELTSALEHLVHG